MDWWKKFTDFLNKLFDSFEGEYPEEQYIPPPIIPVAPITPPNPVPMNTNLPQSPMFPLMIIKWAKLIAIGEGASPESHNLGNLKFSSLTASWGGMKGRAATDGGFLCNFKTDEMGFNALCNFLILGCENQLRDFHQARTLVAFTKIYAGNPPQEYIDGIVQGLGVSPDVDIATFLKSPETTEVLP